MTIAIRILYKLTHKSHPKCLLRIDKKEIEMKTNNRKRIEFKFDVKKLINALAFFAGEVKDLDKLKAAKLLYLVDKHHLVRYGRPILGDCYFRLDKGPIPSRSLDIMGDAIGMDKVNIPTPNRDAFISKLKTTDHKYPRFQQKEAPDLSVFSSSEIESLKETLHKYGKLSSSKLITLTHKDATWQETEQNAEIDYRLFFKNTPSARKEALELMELSQEDRDFLRELDE